MSEPHRHHFVPAFYLRQWHGPDEKLVEYTIKHRKLIPKPVSAEATCFQRDLYEFRELPSTLSQFLEKEFFNYSDRNASDALKMLLDEKARFAATVLGVGFAAALVLIQVGIFFGLLENASITIRPDTIVQHQPDGESTTLDEAACRGMFRFTHGTKSRQDLTSLVPRQPDLRQKISDILAEQSYPVAELNCDRGDQIYVLLDDRQLLAIYRDGDVGAIERLARR